MRSRWCGLRRVAPDTLVFSTIGPLRSSERSWPRADIADIRLGPSSVTVNNRRLNQLQVHTTRGKTIGLLTGWSDPELLWIIEELNAALAPKT